MTTITINLADDLARRLREESTRAKMTTDELIRRALAIYLDEPSQSSDDPLAGLFDFEDENFAERSEDLLQSLVAIKGAWTSKP